MPNFLTCLLIAALFLLLPADARGDMAADQAVDSTAWLRTIVVTVGDVRTRIEADKMWTLSGIEYGGHVAAVQHSAYGTVLTIQGVGHLGTAHFLDVPGKPGEVEKENVTGLALYLDGQLVSNVEPVMNLAGESFRMERESSIRAMKLESTVTLRDGVLHETARLRATEPIDLQSTYPMMYAWTPAATVYAWGDESGILRRGAFLEAGDVDRRKETGVRWLAVFDPASGVGSVCYLLQHPDDAEGSFLLIDAPGVYRKVAVCTFVGERVPAGYEGTFQTAVGFFTATEQDWEAAATQTAALLRATDATPHRP